MMQPLQTLWLLLAAACTALSFKFSYYSGTNARGLSPYELKAGENLLLGLVTIAIGALAIITIFLFKKRVIQLRLCVLGIFLEALLIFLYYREVSSFTRGTYSLTALFQSIIVIAFFLAARKINRDENLVKSSERLR